MVLYRDIADSLREQILSGELPVGQRLPSEATLTATWAASRGTIRQALAALRAEGLIGGGRGAPPVVRSCELSQPFSHLLSFTRWAYQSGRAPGQRTAEITRMPAPQAVADALGIDEGDPIVRLLRLRLLDGVPVMLERTAFPLEYGRVLFTADLDAHSVYAILTEHDLEQVTAHHRFDAVAADAVDCEHLGVAVAAPLLRERRQAALANGELLEYSDDRYRSELVSFTVTNAQAVPAFLSRSGLGA